MSVFLVGHRQFVPLSTMEPGFVLWAPSFFQRTLPAGAPAGTYEVFVLITREGALRKQQLDPDDIVLLQTTTFEVPP